MLGGGFSGNVLIVSGIFAILVALYMKKPNIIILIISTLTHLISARQMPQINDANITGIM